MQVTKNIEVLASDTERDIWCFQEKISKRL